VRRPLFLACSQSQAGYTCLAYDTWVSYSGEHDEKQVCNIAFIVNQEQPVTSEGAVKPVSYQPVTSESRGIHGVAFEWCRDVHGICSCLSAHPMEADQSQSVACKPTKKLAGRVFWKLRKGVGESTVACCVFSSCPVLTIMGVNSYNYYSATKININSLSVIIFRQLSLVPWHVNLRRNSFVPLITLYKRSPPRWILILSLHPFNISYGNSVLDLPSGFHFVE
jgi:hypothetical protein